MRHMLLLRSALGRLSITQSAVLAFSVLQLCAHSLCFDVFQAAEGQVH